MTCFLQCNYEFISFARVYHHQVTCTAAQTLIPLYNIHVDASITTIVLFFPSSLFWLNHRLQEMTQHIQCSFTMESLYYLRDQRSPNETPSSR